MISAAISLLCGMAGVLFASGVANIPFSTGEMFVAVIVIACFILLVKISMIGDKLIKSYDFDDKNTTEESKPNYVLHARGINNG